jgi:hypothetical protein
MSLDYDESVASLIPKFKKLKTDLGLSNYLTKLVVGDDRIIGLIQHDELIVTMENLSIIKEIISEPRCCSVCQTRKIKTRCGICGTPYCSKSCKKQDDGHDSLCPFIVHTKECIRCSPVIITPQMIGKDDATIRDFMFSDPFLKTIRLFSAIKIHE